MANQFTNNKKTKMLAAVVADNMDYIKKSKSYLSESELKNKKYGRSYKVYIPDPGKVIDGIVADPDTINEIEMEITLDNKNTSCELDVWEDLTEMESFRDEIALPRGTKLAKTIQKAVIDQTIFHATQAAIGQANFATLTDASNKLEEVGIAGTKVLFNAPTVNGKIAVGGLSNFIPDSIQKDIYGKSYLGEYAGASQISLAGMPVLKAGGSSITINTTPITNEDGETIGYEMIDEVSCANGKKGEAFAVEGLKIVDVNGMETDQDYVVILTSDSKDGKASIPPLRVTVQGEACGNPNAWVETAGALTATALLESGKEYYIGVCRVEDALAYDTYKFSDLPGSENETVTVDGVSVKMSKYGDGKNMQSLIRLDCPFACGVPEARKQVTVYIEK